MAPFTANRQKRASWPVAALGALIMLAACGPGELGDTSLAGSAANGDPIGTGSIKVGLILPFSSAGSEGATALAMRNAAEMALSEQAGADLQLLPFDTAGTAAGARAAARSAVNSNVRLIVGPLWSEEAIAAGEVAQGAGVPMLAFTGHTGAAAPGVYLMGILPEQEVNWIIGHAAYHGKTRIAALVPDSPFGRRMEAALQQAIHHSSAQIVAIHRYGQGAGEMEAAVDEIAMLLSGTGPQIDALFLPDGPDAMATLAPLLAERGVTSDRVQVLGSRQWNNSEMLQIAEVSGAWYPALDPTSWQSFSMLYRERYGDTPPREATQAFDAVSLAAVLSKLNGSDFSAAVLTDPDGFSGYDGPFRFYADGTSLRALAVMEIVEGAAHLREPPPQSFPGGS